MSTSPPTKGVRRVLFPLAAFAPLVGFAIAVLAHERYTTTHGTGFVGFELVDGPVYRTGTLIVLAAELLLLMALSIWYFGLRSSLPKVTHVRWLLLVATALALAAGVIVTATTRSGRPVDVAFLGIGVFLLFGAACFQLGRSVTRSKSLPGHVGWLLQGVPVAAVLVIVSRNTTLERPALLLFGVLCGSVALLVPPPLRRVAPVVQRSDARKERVRMPPNSDRVLGGRQPRPNQPEHVGCAGQTPAV